jgi:hypothetical protein
MPSDEAAQDAALKGLTVLVGEWTMKAAFPSDEPGSTAAKTLVGRAVFEWALGGRFLAEHTEIPDPDVPDSWAIIDADHGTRAYTQHYFDSRGITRLYAMTLSDGVWTLLREAPDFTPLDFSQRFTGTFSGDGATIAGRWESRSDAASWEHDFELTYTRLR